MLKANLIPLIRIHITTHGGKMEGIPSISTSCIGNDRCIYRSSCKGTVCAGCYAQRHLAYRRSLAMKLDESNSVLYERLLTDEEIQKIPIGTWCFRIESFGDVRNVIHARNYLRIIKANPRTTFGVWSKNTDRWEKAARIEGRPDNMVFMYSSVMMNRAVNIKDVRRIYPTIHPDKIFTVYTKKYAVNQGIKINCGGRRCIECMKCYSVEDDTEYINELKK